MTLRVLVVDDNAQFLASVSALLQRGGFDVVGVASSSAAALARAEELRPDVVLVDIHLADESGFDFARQLAEVHPPADWQVVLMSTHTEEDFADLIAASPVAGFVPKSRLSPAAVNAVLGRASA